MTIFSIEIVINVSLSFKFYYSKILFYYYLFIQLLTIHYNYWPLTFNFSVNVSSISTKYFHFWIRIFQSERNWWIEKWKEWPFLISSLKYHFIPCCTHLPLSVSNNSPTYCSHFSVLHIFVIMSNRSFVHFMFNIVLMLQFKI